jgi:hypothetical protein
MLRLGGRSWIWALSAALAIAIALLAYARRNIVPVSTYTGFLSSQSMEPLRTELYDYVRPAHAEVKPEPPLAFVFPAAYYSDGLSLKGGPVAAVNLQIDIGNWQPFSLLRLKTPIELGRGNNAQEMAQEIRKLDVSVSSNFAMNNGPYSRSSLMALPRVEGLPSKWLGLDLIGYRRVSERAAVKRPPLIVDGVDVNGSGLYAYRETQPANDFLFINCPQTEACRIFFYYYNRGVTVRIYRQYLGRSHEIVRSLIEFLDKHRVSTPPISKFSSEKFFQ